MGEDVGKIFLDEAVSRWVFKVEVSQPEKEKGHYRILKAPV